MFYLSFNNISSYSFIGACIGCKMHNVYYIISKSCNFYLNILIRITYYNYFINIGCIIGFIVGTIYGERTKKLGIEH